MSAWHDQLWPPRWIDLQGDAERVIFVDDALVAVDKPAGVDCAAIKRRVGSALEQRVWLPQTLDRAISGVLVMARTKVASRSLAEQMADGVPKTYEAVVEERGNRRLVAERSNAPHHPVRKRLQNELVGDAVPAHRLMLHLSEQTVVHPLSGEPLTLQAGLPPALRRALDGKALLPDDSVDIVARLRVAAELRYEIARSQTDAFRLANSGGDELPGVEVDRYGDFAVVGLRTEDAVRKRDAVLDAVAELGFEGAYVKIRQKHASVLVDTRDDAIAPRAPVRGRAAPEPLTVHENGLCMLASLGDGLSTGVFLDQRDGRRWVVERRPKTMLNLFAYHGAFTVAAIAGGAQSSVTLDASGAALDGARRNLEAIGADTERHQLVKADAFRWLAGAAKRGRRFDVVVLDPPSFSTTKKSTFRADRDYASLAARALRCVAPGGALLACTNHRGIVPPRFQRMLRRAADDASAPLLEMQPLPAPVDFPPEPGQPHHLKRYVVELAP